MPKAGQPAPATRISTDNYLTAFKAFRDAYYKEGKWTVLGIDFVKGFNEQVAFTQQDEYPNDADKASAQLALMLVKDDKDSYNKMVKGKHGSVKTKIKNDYLKALNIQMGVQRVKEGKKYVWVYSGLSQEDMTKHGQAKAAYTTEINSQMPNLPSYDGVRGARSDTKTGQELLAFLKS